MWAALLATRREVAADRSARFLEAILAGAVKGHRLDVVQIVNVRPPELCGDYIRYQSGPLRQESWRALNDMLCRNPSIVMLYSYVRNVSS